MATKNIGFVAELIGDAEVRSVDGVIRVLSIGDQIHEGDILTTGLNTEIVLEFYDGHKLQVGENTELLLDESVFAGLNAYPDDRADQLAELQNLIVEGVDLAELEATAAGAAADSSDALHQASVYTRDGAEGIVETRGTPFAVGASDLDDQSNLDDDGVLIPANSGDSATNQGSGAMPPPSASITVGSITADDVVNAAEAGSPINVTGTVGGDAGPGDSVTLTVNMNPYSGIVAPDNSFTISVLGSDLELDTSFDATVTGTDVNGNAYSATTTSIHLVDSSAPGLAAQTFSYAENQVDGANVASIVATDNTAVTGFTFTATGTGTSADGYYQIDNSGNITLTASGAASAVNDFE
ncbi:MAG: retention module-containing protein, partial [Gammaproteobacteria bacterium]|nr:retention module-containing protein [Gammaproteobacteria bacterium]